MQKWDKRFMDMAKLVHAGKLAPSLFATEELSPQAIMVHPNALQVVPKGDTVCEIKTKSKVEQMQKSVSQIMLNKMP